jgi:putative hydrolase of the HAD superfamily
VRAIAFDLWDTLLDGPPPSRVRAALRPYRTRALYPWLAAGFAQAAAVEALGADPEAVRDRQLVRRYPTVAALVRAIPRAPGRRVTPALVRETERLFELFAGAARIRRGAAALLVALRARGARLGLVSNTNSIAARAIDRLGLAPLVDAIVLSCDVGICKPDPRIFERTARELGVAPAEVIVVGDSLRSDVRGATAAGMSAVWLARAPAPARRIGPRAIAIGGITGLRALLDRALRAGADW